MSVILFSILLVAILIGNSRYKNLARDVDRLKAAIRRLEEGDHPLQSHKTSHIAINEPEINLYPDDGIPADLQTLYPEQSYEEFISDDVPAGTNKDTLVKQSFEFNLGAKLPVWIGAISIICAGFFLIRYSIENGLVGPGMRTFLAAISGMILAGAGYYISGRNTIANYTRISQGLAGAGLVLLYFTFYAATNMYHFISPASGFIGMAAVTATAVAFSMRMGQAIAIFALIGGLLTPVLMGSDEPNAVMLFAYLFVMSVGMLYMMARNGWWKLATFVVLGFFTWIGIWDATNFAEKDRWALVLFSIAIVASVLTITQKLGGKEDDNNFENPRFILNAVSITGGFFTIGLLAIKVQLSIFDWSMLALLSGACAVLAHYKWGDYQRLLQIKLIADIALFLFWMSHPDLNLTQVVAAVSALAAAYLFFPIYAISRSNRPDYWASIQVVFALAIFAIGFLHYRPLPDYSAYFWAGLAFSLFAISAAAAVLIYRMPSFKIEMQERAMSAYALGATSFLSLGFYISVPWTAFPTVIAGQILVLSILYRKFAFHFLQQISFILMAVFVLLHSAVIVKFSGIMIGGLFGKAKGLFGNFYQPEIYLEKLVVSLFLLGAAFAINRDKNNKWSKSVFGLLAALLCAVVYLALKYVFIEIIDVSEFIERGLVSASLAALGIGIFYGTRKWQDGFYKLVSMIFINAVFLRLVWLDLLIKNPYFKSSQMVGDMMVFNGVTLVYGGGCILALWAIRNLGKMRKVYAPLGLIMLFTFLTLSVTQLFHGRVLADQIMSNRELYSYSIVWLLMSLGLLSVGLKKDVKQIRVAAMLFMALTIGKVFLIDAGELQGLYRIFSFLGLGICLIGLSYFYTRFISRNVSEKV